MELKFTPNAKTSDFNIQELTWSQVRTDVKQADDVLFDIIEQLNPDKTMAFVKARYPYGALIIDAATLHLPHKSGKSIPIHEAEISDTLKKKLLYSSIPLSLP